MFLNQSRLDPALEPRDYCSVEQLRLEVERLFERAWHFVGTRSDLANAGDFLTLDLLGRPILIQNVDGKLRAFLNVCAHRHCALTSMERGNDRRPRCQYHGWEYDAEGQLYKVPDAPSFRPIRRRQFQLVRYRVETCGELIFVCLSDEAVGLAEFLGPTYGWIEGKFTRGWRQIWHGAFEHDANWKVPVENALESYHIPMVHARTFGTYPREAEIEHEFGEGFTEVAVTVARPIRWQKWVVERLRRDPAFVYRHRHCFPNLLLVVTDTHNIVQSVVPTSPLTSRSRVRLFSHPGDGLIFGRPMLRRWVERYIRRGTLAVLAEDQAVFGEVQRGLCSSVGVGTLGTREERILPFQQFVRRVCAPGAVGEDRTYAARPRA